MLLDTAIDFQLCAFFLSLVHGVPDSFEGPIPSFNLTGFAISFFAP